MSGLVAMIVLAYLLVIAACVALWSAVSVRWSDARDAEGPASGGRAARSPRRDTAADDTEARSTREDRSERRTTHDAYRGARARRNDADAVGEPAERRSIRHVAAEGARDRTVRDASARERTEHERTETRRVREIRAPEIRVTEARRKRDQTAERNEDAEDARAREDAFERFLRASKDFER